jgi:hypothetical protein
MILRWKMPFTFARAMWHAFLYWWAGKPVIAPPIVVRYRRNTCRACVENDRKIYGQCRVCACFTDPKTLLSSESCPKGYWKELDAMPKQDHTK